MFRNLSIYLKSIKIKAIENQKIPAAVQRKFVISSLIPIQKVLFFLHLRHSPSPNVPTLPRAQDVHLAQPDPAAAEDGAKLDVGRHDVPQQAGSSIHSPQFSQNLLRFYHF